MRFIAANSHVVVWKRFETEEPGTLAPGGIRLKTGNSSESLGQVQFFRRFYPHLFCYSGGGSACAEPGRSERMLVCTFVACRPALGSNGTAIIIIEVVLTDVVINGGDIICG